MPFADDIADRFPEVERASEREAIDLTLAGEDARCVRVLALRLGLGPDRVVRLALALLARRGQVVAGGMSR